MKRYPWKYLTSLSHVISFKILFFYRLISQRGDAMGPEN